MTHFVLFRRVYSISIAILIEAINSLLVISLTVNVNGSEIAFFAARSANSFSFMFV